MRRANQISFSAGLFTPRKLRGAGRSLCIGIILFVLTAEASFASGPYAQQGPRLVGNAAVGQAFEGQAIALSADGNTLLVGGPGDNSQAGAAWAFTRSNGVWAQQGGKLVGTGATGQFGAEQGSAVALSGDGNTALVGGPVDNGFAGAFWVFTRTNGMWNPQSGKLTATGAVGAAKLGWSAALSGDGNTAIIGGPGDNNGLGAAWIFVRSNGVWAQQGPKLVGTNAGPFAQQGGSVGLSADGNTAVIGGAGDNNSLGAAWVFVRNNGAWTQQGEKLVGTGGDATAGQGASVAVSGDGNTVLTAGPNDNNHAGAVWAFARAASAWAQQGGKLTGSGLSASSRFGFSVSLSSDGNTALVGAPFDEVFVLVHQVIGAAVVLQRSSGTWTQLGPKLVGSGFSGPTVNQGSAVALSSDATTIASGGLADSTNAGAAWIFARTVPITHDFDGNGKSDVLWRNSNGDTVIWFMNGAQIASGTFLGNVPTIWNVVGTGDFNEDGKTDIFWRNTAGDLAMWFMNGSQIVSGAGLGNVPISWTVAGTGDFDGDGKADILWRNSNGDVVIWFMNGAQIASGVFLGNVPTIWTSVGVGDFNGDGKSDILWRNTSGDGAIWLMNGAQIVSGIGLGNIPTIWSVAGVRDFDADGKADILWRNTAGDATIWLMNGGQILSGVGLGNVPTDWSVVGSADFSGDGKSDILWRNTSGDLAMWFMNGGQIVSGAGIGNVPTSWSSQNVNAN